MVLFESHVQPGGYTAGFWRNGFYFESGTLSFESSDRVFKAMEKIGVRDRIRFRKHNPIRYLTPDIDTIPKTWNDLKDTFRAAYPSERDRLDRYFHEIDSMYAVIKAVSGGGIGKFTGMAKLVAMYNKYKDVTASQFTRQYFEKGTKLNRLFLNFGFYPDSPPFVMGAALYSLFEDYWRVEDGMQAWADVLAEQFKASGGELNLSAPVEKILTRDGAAAGVVCRGEEYSADAVIAACDYKQTFLRLLDPEDIPPELAERIREASVSEGIFVDYLGLNIPNDKLRAAMGSAYVTYQDPDREADPFDAADRDYFEKAPLWLFSPSLENPDLAPEGKSSLMVEAVSPHQWMHNWGGSDRPRYLQLKEQVKKTIRERVYGMLPSLRETVEFEDAATPRTFERYTRNTEGATSAWSWNPHKKFHKNIWSVNTDTPVRNLYIGSCWASQIGGVPGALAAAEECAGKIR